MNINFPIQMYDPSRDYSLHRTELDNAIHTQHKITNYMKKNGSTKLFQILIIIIETMS